MLKIKPLDMFKCSLPNGRCDRFFSPCRMLFLLMLLLFWLGGCDSPGDVGLTTIDDIASAPNRIEAGLAPTSEAGLYRDVTGSALPVLAGKVTETGPLSGVELEAYGYLDFLENTDRTTKFKDGSVTDVTIVLKKAYTYGQTDAPIRLKVNAMTAEWTPTNAKYDSLLVAGTNVTTSGDLLAGGTSLEIKLPSNWIQTYDQLLRGQVSGQTFDASFNGFQFQAASGNAILGFTPSDSYLRVVAGGDTLRFSSTSAKAHTYLKRTGKPTQITGQHLLQDNTGDAIKLTFDLAKFQKLPINGTLIRIPADTLALYATGTFQRPIVRQLGVYRVGETGTLAQLASAKFKEGYFTFSDPRLTNEIQRMVIGKSNAIRLIIIPEVGGSSINPLFWFTETSTALKPQLYVTYLPSNS